MDMVYFKRQAISELVEALLGEVWTPARKAEIERESRARGFEPVEHVQLGDFDLSLWQCTGNGPMRDLYMVSINNAQYDPGDLEVHNKRVPRSTISDETLSNVVSELYGWVNKYGRLLIGSVSPRKMKRYRSLLSRMFVIIPFDPDKPENPMFYIERE